MTVNNALEQTLEEPGPRLSAPDASRLGWNAVVQLMTRPQPVTIPMVALFSIVPFYLVIGVWVAGGIVHVPELALDRVVPVQPAWSVIYGSLFCAALLPVFVVHQQELVRRTILAFLMIWLVSYACFLAYPTIGPRPARVIGEGFFPWALRAIYSSDARYNCLPSLHVAQCFLAALACYRVHRGVGVVAGVWALLVGMSTLYTKQHYFLDVIGGMFLAYAAYVIVLRSYPREAVPERERRLAPALAMLAFGVYGLMLVGLWFIYAINGG
jgi:membrane-associated phospholipid phosphatase